MIIILPHAKSRLKERGITEDEVRDAMKNPVEVVQAKYGRVIAFRKVKGRRLVVVYEQRGQDANVFTAFWADARRLRRLGFSRV